MDNAECIVFLWYHKVNINHSVIRDGEISLPFNIPWKKKKNVN